MTEQTKRQPSLSSYYLGWSDPHIFTFFHECKKETDFLLLSLFYYCTHCLLELSHHCPDSPL